MIIFYRIIFIFFYPLIIIFTLFRIFKKKENFKSFIEKNFIINNSTKEFQVWFHGSSIGEVRSIFPMVREILKKKIFINILITSSTISSSKVIEDEFRNEKRIKHVFFPYDIYFLSHFFIKKYNPKIAIFVDSEIWPNFIFSLKKNAIPIILLNARLSAKSFRRWNLIKNYAKKIFSSFNLIISSNNFTFENLKKFSLNNIEYFGNLKLLDLIEKEEAKQLDIQNSSNKNVWLAVSTHPNEEKFIIEAHLILKNKIKNLVTIIIPRHIDRIKSISRLVNESNIKFKIISESDFVDLNYELLLINTVGKLKSFYKSFKIVFVGKSLEKRILLNSGQNPIEPLKFGCNIIHGPYVKNFEEIYDLLNKKDLAKKVSSIDELVKEVENNLNQKKEYNENELEILKKDALKIEKKLMTLLEKHLDVF